MARPPALFVVGVTASGKSALALELAQRLAGEIVCADSRTIYAELSIGAAKPARADREAVPHHLLDRLGLDELLTVDWFATEAERALAKVAARRRLPLIVGGSRLLVQALLFELEHLPLTAAERHELSAWTLEDVRHYFAASQTALPLRHQDRKNLLAALDANRVRVLERPRREALVLGLRPRSAEELEARVRRRVAAMLAAGLEGEVRAICQRHRLEPRELNSIGYEEWQPYFAGQAGEGEVVEQIVANTLSYALAQQLWLAKLSCVHWVQDAEAAAELVHAWRS